MMLRVRKGAFLQESVIPTAVDVGCIYLHYEELAAPAPLALPRLAVAVTVVFRQSCWSVIATGARDAASLDVGGVLASSVSRCPSVRREISWVCLDCIGLP